MVVIGPFIGDASENQLKTGDSVIYLPTHTHLQKKAGDVAGPDGAQKDVAAASKVTEDAEEGAVDSGCETKDEKEDKPPSVKVTINSLK